MSQADLLETLEVPWEVFMEHLSNDSWSVLTTFYGVDAEHARRRANEFYGDAYRCTSVRRKR